jgi:adenylate cyclase
LFAGFLPGASFPRELEDNFRREYNASSAFVCRVCLALGAFLYLAFHVWDRVLDEQMATYTLAIRVAVFAAFVGLISISRTEFFVRHLQGLMSGMTLVAGLGVVAIISIMEDALTLGLAGIVLVLVFNAGFTRLLFLPALMTGVTIALAFNAAAVAHELRPSLLVAYNFVLVAAVLSGGFVTYMLEKLFRLQFLSREALENERRKTEQLLETLLPPHIAARLKSGEHKIAESHAEATVLFADLVGFTQLTQRLSPGHLVEILNDIFSLLDALTGKWGVDKLKTVGDGYMVVCGLGREHENCAEPVADFAIDAIQQLKEYVARRGLPISIRMGISTGQVTSGVIGSKKPTFDVWGETAAIASRMQSYSAEGQIQVTEATYWRLRDNFDLEARGAIDVKGIGPIETFYLVGRKSIPSDSARAPAAS